MAVPIDGLNDAILGELSQIGIEIMKDKDGELGSILPKTIYEITKDSYSEKNYQKKIKNAR